MAGWTSDTRLASATGSCAAVVEAGPSLACAMMSMPKQLWVPENAVTSGDLGVFVDQAPEPVAAPNTAIPVTSADG